MGADWQGFPPPAYARCLGGDAAAAIGETNQSKLVVCRRDATHLHYRGMANSGGVIQLDAVPGPRRRVASTPPTRRTAPNTRFEGTA